MTDQTNQSTASAETPCSASDTIALVRRYNLWRRGDESLEMENPKAIGIALDSICDHAENVERKLEMSKLGLSNAGKIIAQLAQSDLANSDIEMAEAWHLLNVLSSNLLDDGPTWPRVLEWLIRNESFSPQNANCAATGSATPSKL